MKRHNLLNAFLIASVLSTVAMTAIAGPQPIEKTVAPAPPSEIDWAGPYIGFNVGVVWTNYDVSKYHTDVDLEEQFYEAVQATLANLAVSRGFPSTGIALRNRMRLGVARRATTCS